MNKENARKIYLKDFEEQQAPINLFPEWNEVPEVGEQIYKMLKEKDLTHDQAYASLQYTYNLIRYKSNFLQL